MSTTPKNSKTNWFNEDVVPEQMVLGARAELPGWHKLERTEHLKTFWQLLELVTANTVVDLGCGSGELGRLLTKRGFSYVGYDLPHIIDKVAKEVNPQLTYGVFDATESDFTFIKEFDLVVANGFFCEITEPGNVLAKILTNLKNALIIHRQRFVRSPSEWLVTSIYGGLPSISYLWNINELRQQVMAAGCSLVQMLDLEGLHKSVLVQRA